MNRKIPKKNRSFDPAQQKQKELQPIVEEPTITIDKVISSMKETPEKPIMKKSLWKRISFRAHQIFFFWKH